MKYMLLLCDEDPAAFDRLPKAEGEKLFAKIGQWWGEKEHQGVIVGGHQLQPPDTATTVRSKNGQQLVTDGPFMETKEAVGGYAILDVRDLDAAIGVAKEWVNLLPGAIVEVRPVVVREGM